MQQNDTVSNRVRYLAKNITFCGCHNCDVNEASVVSSISVNPGK